MLWPTHSRSARGRMRSIPNQANEAGTRRRLTKTNWQRLLEPASIETLSSSPHASHARCMPVVCHSGTLDKLDMRAHAGETPAHLKPTDGEVATGKIRQRAGRGDACVTRDTVRRRGRGGAIRIERRAHLFQRLLSGTVQRVHRIHPTSQYYTPKICLWRIHDWANGQYGVEPAVASRVASSGSVARRVRKQSHDLHAVADTAGPSWPSPSPWTEPGHGFS